MRSELVTAPAVEPIGLTEAKLHCRIDTDADDSMVSGWIQSAREEAERTMGRKLITQTWRAKLDCFPASGVIQLPHPPLQSVTSVTYVDQDGDEQTLATSEYVVDTSGEGGRIYLAYNKTWPFTRGEPNAVRVLFVAGYGDEVADVPERFRSWMLLNIGSRNAHREGVVTGTIATALPGVDNLVRAERIGL